MLHRDSGVARPVLSQFSLVGMRCSSIFIRILLPWFENYLWRVEGMLDILTCTENAKAKTRHKSGGLIIDYIESL